MNESFANEIEEIVWMKDVSYTDSVVLWCEENNYELEAAALLIKKDPVLRSKIKDEAETANLLKVKKGNRLPI